jgi:hypothetical protein
MISPNDQPPPNEKRLRLFSFAAHFARGLLRDQTMRRRTMFWITLAALVWLFSGATFVAPLIDPHARPGWFIIYWLACAWLTVTAVSLALFDMLLMRAEARRFRADLAEELRKRKRPNDA